MALKPPAGKSFTFSIPEGISGCDGIGRTRVLIVFGWVDNNGVKAGRFFGVMHIVVNIFLMAS